MTKLRQIAYAVFGVACTHLVFGAIVRISGSGMGCGPHWPKCYGYWFPPMSRPDLVIEVTHRYLASILLLSLIGLVVAAYRRRAEPGVGGKGGVLRMATLAMGLGFGAAILGAVTVKLMNSPPATVAHWTVAMSLVAAVTATVIRAGGLGGASARLGGASKKTGRATMAGAGLALVAVVMGGLTAKVQGGPIACLAFPLCGANPAVSRGAVHVQSGHRLIAVLLVFHLLGVFFSVRKRREAPVIRRAAGVALGLGVLQLLIAGAMIGMHLPPALRSLHEATGVSIWIATFTLAYLSRLASGGSSVDPAPTRAPVPPEVPVVPAPTLATDRSTRGPSAASAIVAPASATALATAGAANVALAAGHFSSATPVLARPVVLTAYEPPAAAEVDVEPVLAAAVPVVADIDVVPSPAPASDAAMDADVEPASGTVPDVRLLDSEWALERPEAVERAERILVDSALAFHAVASDAMCAAVAEWQAKLDAAAGLELASNRAELALASEDDVGGPPVDDDTGVLVAEPNQIVARVTIFDEIAPEELDDELYALRGLEEHDEDDDDRAIANDDVLSLDEEFSRLAAERLESETTPEVETAIAAVIAPIDTSRAEPIAERLHVLARAHPLGAVAALFAMRRPTMAHSIAVIVGRGADL